MIGRRLTRGCVKFNKLWGVPLEHMGARAHEYVGLIEIMHSTTVHGVGEITKRYMYFIIFVTFKESMTLISCWSFKVIHFGCNRKRVYDFI